MYSEYTMIVISWLKYYNMSTEDTKSTKILSLEKRDQRDQDLLVTHPYDPLKFQANFGCIIKVFGLKYKICFLSDTSLIFDWTYQ